MKIAKVGIILRKGSDEPQKIASELQDWLTSKSIASVIDQVDSSLDLLIILGGDGTLLEIAEQACKLAIPVVGVNLGDLGFLTEVVCADRYDVIEGIIKGELLAQERMMLKIRLCSEDKQTAWKYALNDVVISKGNIDKLIQLGTWADQDYITTYRADGLIFSTPTGATAYNLSAGGPIVHPALHSILVTPICPFMLDSRPVLLAPEIKLKTRLIADQAFDVKVIVDGQTAWDMKENDCLEVQASEKKLMLIGSPQKGYFEILRSKLNWGSGVKSRKGGGSLCEPCSLPE